MEKIAILTLPLSLNYGGDLQAYALQQVLLKLGYEVCVLNFKDKETLNYRQVLSKIKRAFFFREILNLEKSRRNFVKKNINITPVLYTAAGIKYYIQNNQIDTIIVGSDQVWRKDYVMPHTSDMLNYFLNFISEQKVNKISYAASFGIDQWQFDDAMTQEIKTLLHGFKKVSVREDSAKKLCKEYLQLPSEHVLDPTMLVDIENYESLIREVETDQSIKKCQGKIFSYVLDTSADKTEIQNMISHLLDKPLIHNKVLNFFQQKKNTAERINVGVENWLLAFKYCDYIITDSFHGTVFSILFKKPFVVLINKQRGATRFTSLLNMFDLGDRIVNDKNDLNEEFLYKIDYDTVHRKLNELKKNSLKFLMSLKQ